MSSGATDTDGVGLLLSASTDTHTVADVDVEMTPSRTIGKYTTVSKQLASRMQVPPNSPPADSAASIGSSSAVASPPFKNSTHGSSAATDSKSCFSNFYSGAILLVHSFLSFTELLHLARVCQYHRKVALGVISPSGLMRLGKDIPHVSWDVLQNNKYDQLERAKPLGQWCSNRCTSRVDSASCVSCQFLRNSVPSFVQLLEYSLHKFSSSSAAAAALSKQDMEEFIAVIPAPIYDTPPSARRVIFSPSHTSLDLLLLSPIVARHMRELYCVWETTPQNLSTISLRFPYLAILTTSVNWNKQEKLNTSNEQLSSLLNTIHLPSNLRKFNLTPWNNIGAMCKEGAKLITQLPIQCRQLEELTISLEVTLFCDLTPLLHLPHLSVLLIGKIVTQPSKRSKVDHCQTIHQLTRLRTLHIGAIRLEHLPRFLPAAGNSLEEFILPSCEAVDEMNLKIFVERTPQLRVLRHPSRWSILDHTLLGQLRSMRTLIYSQSLISRRGVSAIGRRCITAHGSLQAHVEHVISVFSQLHCLTELNLTDFYTPVSSRSIVVNAKYFDSRGLKYPLEKHLLWDDQAIGVRIPEDDYEIPHVLTAPGTIYSPFKLSTDALRSHTLYQLTTLLPQLLKLQLSGTSALHLPSLSFLANLPNLQTFTLLQAYCLPVESLYDLRFVADSLTRLHISDSFPKDSSGFGVYLLHDVLQPLQFSIPLTKAFTIDFPESSRNPNVIREMQSTYPTGNEDESSASSSSTYDAAAAGVHSIPPRHSSWCEIRKPVVTNATPACPAELAPFRRVFISKTIHADPIPVDANLTSLLLPRLQHCEIRHSEPSFEEGSFVYDRLQQPRHRLEACPHYMRNSDYEACHEYIEKTHKQMRELYGVVMNPEASEVIGSDYRYFLEEPMVHLSMRRRTFENFYY